jgi:hypothetical protein
MNEAGVGCAPGGANPPLSIEPLTAASASRTIAP